MFRKIKILHVVNVFGGAVGRILVDVMPHLVKKFDVKVVSIQSIDYSDPLVQEYIRKYNNLESLKLNRFSLFKAYHKLNCYFKKIDPDLIHSHMGRADIFTAMSKTKNIIIMKKFIQIKTTFKYLRIFATVITFNFDNLTVM